MISEPMAPAHQRMAMGSRPRLANAFQVAWMTAAPSTSASAAPLMALEPSTPVAHGIPTQ